MEIIRDFTWRHGAGGVDALDTVQLVSAYDAFRNFAAREGDKVTFEAYVAMRQAQPRHASGLENAVSDHPPVEHARRRLLAACACLSGGDGAAQVRVGRAAWNLTIIASKARETALARHVFVAASVRDYATEMRHQADDVLPEAHRKALAKLAPRPAITGALTVGQVAKLHQLRGDMRRWTSLGAVLETANGDAAAKGATMTAAAKTLRSTKADVEDAQAARAAAAEIGEATDPRLEVSMRESETRQLAAARDSFRAASAAASAATDNIATIEDARSKLMGRVAATWCRHFLPDRAAMHAVAAVAPGVATAIGMHVHPVLRAQWQEISAAVAQHPPQAQAATLKAVFAAPGAVGRKVAELATSVLDSLAPAAPNLVHRLQQALRPALETPPPMGLRAALSAAFGKKVADDWRVVGFVRATNAFRAAGGDTTAPNSTDGAGRKLAEHALALATHPELRGQIAQVCPAADRCVRAWAGHALEAGLPVASAPAAPAAPLKTVAATKAPTVKPAAAVPGKNEMLARLLPSPGGI